jgi:hypothetical protein
VSCGGDGVGLDLLGELLDLVGVGSSSVRGPHLARIRFQYDP